MSSDLAANIVALEAFLREEGVYVARDEPLAGHSSFGIGGPADLYVSAISVDDLSTALLGAREQGVPTMVVGGCTNLLWSDRGFRGLVIHNGCTAQRMPSVAWRRPAGGLQEDVGEGSVLFVEAGVGLSALARKVSHEGWEGLAWAVGIPGTVGGAIVNNAGAFGHSMAESVKSVHWIDREGRQGTWIGDVVGFGYRTSRLRGSRDWAVVSAQLSLHPGDSHRLQELMRECIEKRRSTQPQGASAGSVFRNPPGDFAGRLIEEAGLKGRRVGSAHISAKHANYILNDGGATAEDVRSLIDLAREEVARRFGVTLELEIELVGAA